MLILLGFNWCFGIEAIVNLHLFLSAVTSVKFANGDNARIACASADSTLSICQVMPSPATVICMLRGHTAAVTGQFAHHTPLLSLFVFLLQANQHVAGMRLPLGSPTKGQ